MLDVAFILKMCWAKHFHAQLAQHWLHPGVAGTPVLLTD